jgi:hypothetical protein
LNRKALLISSTNLNIPDTFILEDLNNWRSFLKSPSGGGWFESDDHEILTLINPSKNEILKEIKSISIVDFSIVLFIGEGYLKKDFLGFDEYFLYLKDNDEISERDLNPGNERCLIVFDTFRSYDSINKNIFIDTDMSLVTNYRVAYENYLMQCEKGLIKIFPFNFKTFKSFSFSNILLNITESWINKNQGILKIDEAMELVDSYFIDNLSEEAPVYQGGRRLRHFPFAINLSNQLHS